MGDLSFNDMVAMVKYRCGNNTGPEDVNGTNFYGVWVNWAYRHLCAGARPFKIPAKIHIPELETSTTSDTTEGTAFILVPVDSLNILKLFNETNNRKLSWITLDSYVRREDREDSSGYAEPLEWTRSGQRIYLYPTPDDAYTIRIYYRKIPATLSGTNVTVIGKEWDEPIVLLAAYKALVWMNDYDKAKETKGELIDVLTNLAGIHDSEERDREEYWRVDPAYWPVDT
jgi:hypothetical protein